MPESVRLSPKKIVCEYVCAKTGAAASASAAASTDRTGVIIGVSWWSLSSLSWIPGTYARGWRIEPCGHAALTPHCVKNRADWPVPAQGATIRLMDIVLNGEPRAIAANTTVAQLLQAEGLGERRVAVEVNNQIVPRSRHVEHPLVEGDRVEIVHALGGG
ncbi:hypothetical protein GCM10025759_25540 [Lysobacter panacisoli]|uniref:Sulfur carrier protein ThiS n=2 Tax=Lysobacter panacisoli TaxID=1255263 RepID=A0ABP9LLF9_9GAMM